jgi:hypothetical protein
LLKNEGIIIAVEKALYGDYIISNPTVRHAIRQAHGPEQGRRTHGPVLMSYLCGVVIDQKIKVKTVISIARTPSGSTYACQEIDRTFEELTEVEGIGMVSAQKNQRGSGYRGLLDRLSRVL